MRKFIMVSVAAAALLTGCNSAEAPMAPTDAVFELPKVDLPENLRENTLLAQWSGPYGYLEQQYEQS